MCGTDRLAGRLEYSETISAAGSRSGGEEPGLVSAPVAPVLAAAGGQLVPPAWPPEDGWDGGGGGRASTTKSAVPAAVQRDWWRSSNIAFRERRGGGWRRGLGGLSPRLRWQRNQTSSHQVWACHLFLNDGRWWAWRWRSPLSLPRCASVMDAASGSAAEEAEAHLLEPIRLGGWGGGGGGGRGEAVRCRRHCCRRAGERITHPLAPSGACFPLASAGSPYQSDTFQRRADI